MPAAMCLISASPAGEERVTHGPEAPLRDVGSGMSQLLLSTGSLLHTPLLGLSHLKVSLKEGFRAGLQTISSWGPRQHVHFAL